MERFVPLKVLNKFHPHQIELINFAMSVNGRIYIADEMGLGKTISSFTVAYIYKNEWPLLVICPASLRNQWKSEILKWYFPFVNNEDIVIVTKEKQACANELK